MMAGIYPLDTPSRVLGRVQQMEKEGMELPSLPSLDDIYGDSYNDTYDDTPSTAKEEQEVGDESLVDKHTGMGKGMVTPHPLRQVVNAYLSTESTNSEQSADSFSTTSGSPFPPRANGLQEEMPSSYVPDTPLTSTPLSRHSRSQSRSLANSTNTHRTIRNETANGASMGTNSGIVRRERWQTPGELSRSFSGDEIPSSATLGFKKSNSMNDNKNLNGLHNSPERLSLTAPEETPTAQRLSNSNIQLERPNRRAFSNAQPLFKAIEDSPRTTVSSLHGLEDPVQIHDSVVSPKERIPSLSRSEVTGTDHSVTSTPEGPIRNVSMMTPRPDALGEYELTKERDYHLESQQEVSVMDHQQGYEYSTYQENVSSDNPEEHFSPTKAITPSKNVCVSSDSISATETIRAIPRTKTSSTSNLTPAVLQDVTYSRQNILLTPSPNVTPRSLGTETPNVPLDDAQRRKSHVLAVLNSATSSSRGSRSVRGTPHPLRRVSTAPMSKSIAEDNDNENDQSFGPIIKPGMISHLTDPSGNDSFVSIASSADLTTDGRAHNRRTSRGNTSFPILPINPSTSSGSFKGFSDSRAPNSKIVKHINEMNKQLLETNAELAREAEAWRDEVNRLHEFLKEKGMNVEDVSNLSQRLPTPPRHSPSRASTSPKDNSAIISQLFIRCRQNSPSQNALDLLEGLTQTEQAAILHEMAEKLESLEGEVNLKVQIISNLQEQLETAHNLSPSSDLIYLQEQVEDLHHQLEQAERAREDLQSQFSKQTEEHRQKFGEICEELELQLKSSQQDLAAARLDVDCLQREKTKLEELAVQDDNSEKEKDLREQIRTLQSEIEVHRKQIKERAQEIEDLGIKTKATEEERDEVFGRLEEIKLREIQLKQQLADSEGRVEQVERDFEVTKAELKEACIAQTKTEDKLSQVQAELHRVYVAMDEKEQEIRQQQDVIEELNGSVHKLETAQEKFMDNEWTNDELQRVGQDLQEARTLLEEKNEVVEKMKSKLADLEFKLTRITTSAASTPSGTENSAQNSFVIALEDRLDEAYREINRLKNDIHATPHRKSAIEVRDLRIQALEREKAALADRLTQFQGTIGAKSTGTEQKSVIIDAGSPFQRATPVMSTSIASLRGMKPPGIVYDPSELQITMQSTNTSFLEAQLGYLQEELQRANSQLDRNFNRLETAGLDAYQLAQKLQVAQERISELEDEMRVLMQKNKSSVALADAQKKEQDREAERRLQEALSDAHEQMEQLKADISDERERLQLNNSRLQNFIAEMRLKSDTEDENYRMELKRMAQASEKEALAFKTKNEKAEREKDNLRHELQASRDQIVQLERELSNERRAYDSLSRRNAQVVRDSPVASQLQNEIAEKSRAIADLEMSLREVQLTADCLRETIAQRDQALRQAESQLQNLSHERKIVANELGEFEKDLAKHKSDSDGFGKELHSLKREQAERLESHAIEVRELQSEIEHISEREKRARKELDEVQTQYNELKLRRKSHENNAESSEAFTQQKLKFRMQSRELAAQIKYLKAKYTRESTFRNALALQKKYLLLLVGGKSLNEQATLKAIAKMGFPIPEPPRPVRTFKAVAVAILSTIRARNTARKWRAEVDLRLNLVTKHSEIREKTTSSR
ncbi:uncharacterized protein L203_102941 [Cryptococcus depauperatus CBS 7841]|uniref:Pericentrin/AKAP-450 centrosomal targeting domain-containing protein n=1 Tax=Cryptococcus depauperatus CBS 7841 TaxID=1295531 RepID=A0AAJ8JSV9_9TREE